MCARTHTHSHIRCTGICALCVLLEWNLELEPAVPINTLMVISSHVVHLIFNLTFDLTAEGDWQCDTPLCGTVWNCKESHVHTSEGFKLKSVDINWWSVSLEQWSQWSNRFLLLSSSVFQKHHHPCRIFISNTDNILYMLSVFCWLNNSIPVCEGTKQCWSMLFLKTTNHLAFWITLFILFLCLSQSHSLSLWRRNVFVKELSEVIPDDYWVLTSDMSLDYH